MNNLGKKSLLFSLMTLILLIPIFIASTIYLENNERQNQHASAYVYARRTSYVTQDILYDLTELMGFTYEFNRSENKTLLRFSDWNATDSTATIDAYQTWVENNFASLQNIEVSLNVTGITLNNLSLNVSDRYVSFENVSELMNITIYLQTLDPDALNMTSSPGNDVDGINITIVVFDSEWDEVLNISRTLNPDQVNSKFYIEFNTSILNLELSSFEFNISSSMDFTVLNLTFIYPNSPVFMEFGSISFEPYLGFSKNATIALIS